MTAFPSRQRGIALLVALLTVALAAVLIAGLLDRGELSLARTRNTLRAEQADAYALGLEAYAGEVLLKDLAQDPNIDTNSEIWAAPLPPQQVPGGLIVASLHDLNGCFNLNNLADSQGAAGWNKLFTNLLAARGVDPSIATAVAAWIGAPGGDNADTTDAFYLAQEIPYRSAQRVFAHVSELRLVRGVTSEIYARIAPFVCALPVGTKINVNTASVPVLQALGTDITAAQAESMWQDGQAQWSGIEYVQAWQNQHIVVDADIAPLLETKSTYFIARGDIQLDDVPFTFFSLIERSPGFGVRVVGRSRGADDALVTSVTAATDDHDGH